MEVGRKEKRLLSLKPVDWTSFSHVISCLPLSVFLPPWWLANRSSSVIPVSIIMFTYCSSYLDFTARLHHQHQQQQHQQKQQLNQTAITTWPNNRNNTTAISHSVCLLTITDSASHDFVTPLHQHHYHMGAASLTPLPEHNHANSTARHLCQQHCPAPLPATLPSTSASNTGLARLPHCSSFISPTFLCRHVVSCLHSLPSWKNWKISKWPEVLLANTTMHYTIQIIYVLWELCAWQQARFHFRGVQEISLYQWNQIHKMLVTLNWDHHTWLDLLKPNIAVHVLAKNLNRKLSMTNTTARISSRLD